VWTLEEGIRQLTSVPAAMAGFADRGTLLPGWAADVMIFDPATVGPGTKQLVRDMPGGEARFSARPRGFAATIVNGVPIVENGTLRAALPGRLVCPLRAV
jgi:N-acyl-D-aspartate/D-glutamate deacylase